VRYTPSTTRCIRCSGLWRHPFDLGASVSLASTITGIALSTIAARKLQPNAGIPDREPDARYVQEPGVLSALC